MNTDLLFPMLTLLLLGAFHGVNPGMGWLFAVALGLQERKRSAVWRSLLPLALGHALAVAVALLVMVLAGRLVSVASLKWAVAAVLLAFGVYRLFRHGHPRYGGMQVGARDLTVWSFLMASAHGAGLMVLPFVFGTAVMQHHASHTTALPAAQGVHVHEAAAGPMGGDEPGATPVAAGGGHAQHAADLLSDLPAEPIVGLLATLVHTAGYLLVMGILAVVVYEKVGLRLLRKAWLNLDLVWAAALILTAIVTVMV